MKKTKERSQNVQQKDPMINQPVAKKKAREALKKMPVKTKA